MVNIPQGNFIMGIPDREQKRSFNETPEHEVLIYNFFVEEVRGMIQYIIVVQRQKLRRNV
jgi:formylglycine-generating enzyme required for sulfatase activity